MSNWSPMEFSHIFAYTWNALDSIQEKGYFNRKLYMDTNTLKWSCEGGKSMGDWVQLQHSNGNS